MTGIELEAAAADAAAELGRTEGSPLASRPEACPNCDAVLAGRYCHDCGQSSDLHKRSLLHLTWEAVEGLFHLDGRLARTLPLLFLRPGVLARDLMEGRLARHTPPFRTFLVALLLFILAAEAALHSSSDPAHGLARVQAGGPAAAGLPSTSELAWALSEAALEEKELSIQVEGLDPAWQDKFKAGLRIASENPAYFLTVLFGWAHRLAFLLLPITAALLTLLYVGNRGLYVHDHILVASNLMSFALLTNAAGLVLPDPLQAAWFTLLFFWTPLNIFQTLLGGYGSGVPGAMFKTLILWQGSVVAFGLLIVGLFTLTLIQL